MTVMVPTDISSLWAQQYAQWHHKTLASLTQANWKDFKYLILYCPPQGNCAGTSDRLQPVVWHLRIAERTNRLFFIHWDHPYPLEEFLIPAGTLNWSMPEWLVNVTQPRELPTLVDPDRNITEFDDNVAITIRMKLGYRGAVKRYDAMQGEGAFARVYSNAFNLLFRPSPPVSKLLEERMESAGLTKDMYAVSHSRILYKKELPEKTKLRALVSQALDCASELMPGAPIYFASDALEAKEEVQFYAIERNHSVVVFTDLEPIHLESATNHTIQDYYPIFVDLYIMSYGRCITYDAGGYGKWANLMSSNVSCAARHSDQRCLRVEEQNVA